MIKCPTCGSPDCVRPAEEVLRYVYTMYSPCASCSMDKPLDKFTPLVELCLAPDEDFGRCPSCGKRHLDYVMAQVLNILIEAGLMDAKSSLKDVGTPLISYGTSLVEPPRLPTMSVAMVLDHVDEAAAHRIITEVPEVKGVIKRSGRQTDSVGILDTGLKPHLYKLLAGCDVRADVVSSLLGELVLYRNQSQCHIEFRRNNSVKVKAVEKLFLDGMLEGRIVVDGFASVGTLGLIAALGGAKKVIINDAWLPAIRNILLNLEVNKELLGIEVHPTANLETLPAVGDLPVLVATASGLVEIEVYQGDFRKLDRLVPACDVCIIDTFPGVNPEPFAKRWNEITTRKVLVL